MKMLPWDSSRKFEVDTQILDAVNPMQIKVNLQDQRLILFDSDGSSLLDTKVSTARNGPGEIENSLCTPRGWHLIRAKIGDGLPANTVFRARRPTGEIYTPQLKQKFPNRDWILTRILWLSGLEPGFNRLGDVDTMRRYIYIHGCPEEDPMGVESSSGCIKMRNDQLIRLFQLVSVGTRVYIDDGNQNE